jgi:hypothetical protein
MQLVEFEILSPKKTSYILYENLQKKYSNRESIFFTEQELKSLIARSFAVELHSSNAKELTETDRKNFISDSNLYFKISIDFGLILLDNLLFFQVFSSNKNLKNWYLITFLNFSS